MYLLQTCKGCSSDIRDEADSHRQYAGKGAILSGRTGSRSGARERAALQAWGSASVPARGDECVWGGLQCD